MRETVGGRNPYLHQSSDNAGDEAVAGSPADLLFGLVRAGAERDTKR